MGDERRVVYDGDIDEEVQAVLQQAWSSAGIRRALIDGGLRPAEAERVASPAPLAAGTLDEDDDDNDGLALLIGTLAAVLLFISLQVFGNYVLVGVVEEKSTAVVELLLVRVRADQLLAGKVIGIGAVALFQFVLAVVAGLVALAISGVEVPGYIWSALPMTSVWFLGGYVPESGASRVLSLLPPIAPFLMPMRMAAGAASIAEVTIALVLLGAATVATWKLAAQVYEQVLLRRGSRIAWREVATLLRR